MGVVEGARVEEGVGVVVAGAEDHAVDWGWEWEWGVVVIVGEFLEGYAVGDGLVGGRGERRGCGCGCGCKWGLERGDLTDALTVRRQEVERQVEHAAPRGLVNLVGVGAEFARDFGRRGPAADEEDVLGEQ